MSTIKLRVRELLAEREARDQRRWHMADLAAATDTPAETLALLLNNQADVIELTTLATLCDFFHCTPADLLRYTADAPGEDVIDARDIVDKWHREYGADEHPPRS